MKPRKAGRPKRQEFETLSARVWYNAVRIRSGLSDRALAREFGGGAAGWTRYHQGASSPTRDRVLAVDKRYPGTRRYFDAPLWPLLDIAKLGVYAMRYVFAWLQEPLKSHFMEQGPEGEYKFFWRRQTETLEDLRMLRSGFFDGETLDKTTALIALLHDAAFMQDRKAFALCVEAWASYISRRREYTDAVSIAPEEPFFEFGLFAYEQIYDHELMQREDSFARAIFSPYLEVAVPPENGPADGT